MSLLLDAGMIDAGTAGNKGTTISQALAPDTYWLATVSQGGAPTLRSITGGPCGGGSATLAGAMRPFASERRQPV